MAGMGGLEKGGKFEPFSCVRERELERDRVEFENRSGERLSWVVD